MDAIGNATAGIAASTRRFDEAAARIADPAGRPEVDLAKEAADLVAEQTNFAANVAVLRTGSRMTGRLLDIMV